MGGHFYDNKCKGRVFFAFGNGEVQRHLSREYNPFCGQTEWLNKLFLLSSLLSDELIQPTAHYCVDATRKLTLRNKEIFEDECAFYVLGEDVKSYEEDLNRKRLEYPTRIDFFGNQNITRSVVSELQYFGKNIKRSGSIGLLTGHKWKKAISDSHAYIYQNLPATEMQRLYETLIFMPDIRGGRAFDWTYVLDKLEEEKFELPTDYVDKLDTLLLECYLAAWEELYHCERVITTKTILSATNINLFYNILKQLGLHKIILGLQPSDIITIKHQSDSFVWFREAYFKLIEDAKYLRLSILEQFEAALGSERFIEKNKIQQIFQSSCQQLITAMSHIGIYERPDKLYNPSSESIYAFKKTFVNYDRIPLIQFRDEILAKFSKTMISAIEKGLISLESKVFYKCNFTIGEISMGDIIINNSSFEKCSFGDNATVIEINNNLDRYKYSLANDETIRDLVQKLVSGISSNDTIPDLSKVELLSNIDKACSLMDTTNSNNVEVSKAQGYWNEVKEGLKTSGSLTTIAYTIGKLFGFW